MRGRLVGITGIVSLLATACGAATDGGDPIGNEGGVSGTGAKTSTGGTPSAGGAGGHLTGGEAGQSAGGTDPSGFGGYAGGGTSTCGDNYCDVSIGESCNNCPLDCFCETGGAGGSTATGGAGGTAGGTGLHQDVLDRAKSGVGFSYWWGHGRFRPEGPTSSNAGDCSGSCPSCTHTGSYGGDCSGFVGKVWQVPASNTDMTIDDHPYSTFDFVDDTSNWSTIDQGTLQAADAMVYNNGSAGHIFIYSHGDPWGSMYAYECKGCSYGCTGGFRTATSSYHAIRRTGY